VEQENKRSKRLLFIQDVAVTTSLYHANQLLPVWKNQPIVAGRTLF
jgi:hypothetical protein